MIKLGIKFVLEAIKSIEWTPLKVSIAANVLAVIAIIFLLQPPKEIKPEVKIVEKTITIPGKPGKLDTIKVPEPYYVKNPVNNELLTKYQKLKDSIAKEKLFVEAITENDYNESYEDSLVKIDIYTKVQGKLLKQAPTYLIKPSTISFQDTTTIITKYEPKSSLKGLLEVGLPVDVQTFNPIFKANILLQNKKNNIYSLGYDTNNVVWLGTTINF